LADEKKRLERLKEETLNAQLELQNDTEKQRRQLQSEYN